MTIRQFSETERCPLAVRSLITAHNASLLEYGAISRYGYRRILVDPDLFMRWLKEVAPGEKPEKKRVYKKVTQA